MVEEKKPTVGEVREAIMKLPEQQRQKVINELFDSLPEQYKKQITDDLMKDAEVKQAVMNQMILDKISGKSKRTNK